MTKRTLWALILGVTCVLMAGPASAQQPGASDKYDEQLSRYLESARTQASSETGHGRNDWMNGLMADARARKLNDLVTIRVVESISASGTADSNLSKSSSGSAAVPGLFGVEKKLPALIDPANLASAKSNTQFKGAGTTTRAGELTAIVTGRVAEVLPNGDLFIESVREIDINGDRQVVVLTGVARVADISPSNIVMPNSAFVAITISPVQE